jgi:SAM-dependent methyltransferase
MNRSHYTFGDNDLAAARLEALAETYAPSSAAFIARARPESVRRAVDLGSGLGLTTELLAQITGAQITGYERSPKYLDLARRRFPALIFHEVDVLAPPYPDSGVDLVYSRFLLTHLPAPEIVVKACLDHLRPGGRLLLEETAELESPVPALQRYYGLVKEMQAHYGQELHMGRRLPELAAGIAHVRVDASQTPLTMPASTMARLHAMNIATWKKDPFMSQAHSPAELNELESQLQQIAADHTQPAGLCVMAQVIMERSCKG